MTPTYFTDRDLGKQFPAILRAAGISVERHVDHFAPAARDDEWLPIVAQRGWVILSHDQRIRYKKNERDAVMENGARLFVVIGKLPVPVLAQGVVNTHPRMQQFIAETPAPFIAKVYRATARELVRSSQAAGRVEAWLTEKTWRR